MNKKIFILLIIVASIYLGISIPAAWADFCDHSLIKIENQSAHPIEILAWEAQLYSQIKIRATNPLGSLPPGASVYFEVDKLSFLIYDTGGRIRLKYKTKQKKGTAQLDFVFHPILLTCVPKDMTSPTQDFVYQKLAKPAREQSELVYVFRN